MVKCADIHITGDRGTSLSSRKEGPGNRAWTRKTYKHTKTQAYDA